MSKSILNEASCRFINTQRFICYNIAWIFARSAYYVGACSILWCLIKCPCVCASGFFVISAVRHLTRRHHFWVLDKGDKNPVWHFGFFKKGPISWISRWCEHSPGPVFGPLFWWFLWKINNKTRRCFWRFKSKYRKIDLTRTCKLQTFYKKM